MKFLILISLSALLTHHSFAQSKYSKGYVVTNKYDTIYGELRDRTPEPFGKILKKVRMKGFWIFEKKFSPYDLISYKIGSNIYESLWYKSYFEFFRIFHVSSFEEGEKVFMRVAVDGKLKLYWDEYRDADSGYEEQIPFFKKTNSSELVRVTQGIFGFKKKKLTPFFEDCPEIISKMNEGFFNTPQEMAEYYNSKCY